MDSQIAVPFTDKLNLCNECKGCAALTDRPNAPDLLIGQIWQFTRSRRAGWPMPNRDIAFRAASMSECLPIRHHRLKEQIHGHGDFR